MGNKLRGAAMKELIEKLAALEHEQWVSWSRNLASVQAIFPNRLGRWKRLWKPYEELSEGDKEKDRIWARKVIELLEKESNVKT
jgi:hypothetical protein